MTQMQYTLHTTQYTLSNVVGDATSGDAGDAGEDDNESQSLFDVIASHFCPINKCYDS